MKRIQIVNDCRDCKWYTLACGDEQAHEFYNICTKEGKVLQNILDIPDWCVLEKYHEVKDENISGA